MSHDQLFKELLHRFLPQFIAAFLPAEARQIDWRRVEFQNTEVFTESLRGERRAVDVLARVRTLAGEPELILVHVEIEADPRPEFAGRMYRYYELLRRRRKLPVLPVAVYLRGGFGGITLGRYEERLFQTEILRFQYHLLALPDVLLTELPAGNPVTHALAPLLSGHADDPLELLLESFTGIERTEEEEERRALLVNFVQSYVPLMPEQMEELKVRLHGPEREEVREMLTVWEQYGQTKGRVQGLYDSIRRVLEARFGQLYPTVEEALAQVTGVEMLEELVTVAATADSLEEFTQRLPGEAAERNGS